MRGCKESRLVFQQPTKKKEDMVHLNKLSKLQNIYFVQISEFLENK